MVLCYLLFMLTCSIPVLETSRLRLVPPTLADAPAIQKYVNDPDILQYMSGFPQPYPDDGAEHFLRNFALPGMERGTDWLWGLRLKTNLTQELVGSIHISGKGLDSEGQRYCTRGFWLAKHLHQQGLMTEASEAATSFAFIAGGFDYMEIHNAVANRASSRIKQAAGFRLMRQEMHEYTGGVMPAEIWRVTRDEWFAHHPLPQPMPASAQKKMTQSPKL
jgi:RimJ/RimL family protein N-acetyltransferase